MHLGSSLFALPNSAWKRAFTELGGDGWDLVVEERELVSDGSVRWKLELEFCGVPMS